MQLRRGTTKAIGLQECFIPSAPSRTESVQHVCFLVNNRMTEYFKETWGGAEGPQTATKWVQKIPLFRSSPPPLPPAPRPCVTPGVLCTLPQRCNNILRFALSCASAGFFPDSLVTFRASL